jgi:hypothetical protein
VDSPGTGKGLSAEQRVDEVVEYWINADGRNPQTLRKRVLKMVKACERQAVERAMLTKVTVLSE